MSSSSPNSLHSLTASQALQLLRSDTITAEEYARSLLERVQERDGTIKAWAFLGECTRWEIPFDKV